MSKKVLSDSCFSQKAYDTISISSCDSESSNENMDFQNEIIFRQECRIWLRENAKALFDLEKKKKRLSFNRQNIADKSV